MRIHVLFQNWSLKIISIRQFHRHYLPTLLTSSQLSSYASKSSENGELGESVIKSCSKEQYGLEEDMDSLFHMDTAASDDVYSSHLKGCIRRKSLTRAMLVYTHVTIHVTDLNGLLGDYLVVALAKCGGLDDAYSLSCSLASCTVFSWTALISAYVDNGRFEDALRMYSLMEQADVQPNQYTFASLFKACGNLHDINTGRQLHSNACLKGFTSYDFVSNTIVNMYGKCGCVSDAEYTFSTAQQHSVVSWNSMMSVYVEQGFEHRAILLYRQMKDDGAQPDQLTVVNVVRACGIIAENELDSSVSTKTLCLDIGRAIHAYAHRKDFIENVFVGTTLVSMYSKFGALVEAQAVFTSMSQRNSVSWNAMLSAYVEQGQGRLALQLYMYMQEEGRTPDQHTIATTLKACYSLLEMEHENHVKELPIEIVALSIGEAIYDDARRLGYASDIVICTALLNVYGKCGEISKAEKVFGALNQRNIISWTALLSAYTSSGHGMRALLLYRQMQEEGWRPDQQVLVIAIQACSLQDNSARAISLEIGQAFHADSRRMGFESDIFVGSSLVNLYGKLGDFPSALNVFIGSSKQNAVSWTALLSAYVEQGEGQRALQLYHHMLLQGIHPDQQAILTTLQACACLAETEQSQDTVCLEIIRGLHKDAFRMGYMSDAYITSSLLNVYGKCAAIDEAENLFVHIVQPNLVSWTALASTFVEQGLGQRALQLYKQMQCDGLYLDKVMFVILLRACDFLREALPVDDMSMPTMSLEIGQALHADLRKASFETNNEIGNTLIRFYGIHGKITEAEHVFSGLMNQNVLSYNALLSAYVEHGLVVKVLQLYRYMQEQGIHPNQMSVVIALQACTLLGKTQKVTFDDNEEQYKSISLEIIQALHFDVSKIGIDLDISTSNTVLTVYGKSGTIADAENVFNSLSSLGVSSWNAMLSAYVRQGQGVKALILYKKMRNEHVLPDNVTYICALKASAETGSLEMCREVHFEILCAANFLDPNLAATLIHAYGNSASSTDGQTIYDNMPLVHLPSATACIAGYASEGHSLACLEALGTLQHSNAKLDETIFTSILAACSHSGLVNKGLECFESMIRDHSLSPDSMHYGSLIDLLGRAGQFSRIANLLLRIPIQVDSSIWSSLIGACRAHGNKELGKEAFNNAIRAYPKQASMYVVMSNIFAESE